MKALHLHDRVVSKANPNFHGEVVEAAADGLSGYVLFDFDENPDDRTFYSAGELDPEILKENAIT